MQSIFEIGSRGVLLVINFILMIILSGLAEAADSTPGKQEGQATLWIAHVLRRKTKDLVIPEIGLTKTQFPVTLVPQGERLRPLVVITAYMNKPSWKLFAQNDSTPLLSDGVGEFKVYTYLNAKVNEVTLTIENSGGEKIKETLYIYAPEAMEFQAKSPWDELMVAVGATRFQYFQSNFGNYAANTGLLSLQYNPEIKSRWGLLARLDMTVLTVNATPVSNGPQLIEGKMDGTYTFGNEFDSDIRTQIVFGQNYLTMLGNGSPFGFANLISPELGVRWRYFETSKTTYITDFRYVMVKNFLNKEEFGFNLSLIYSRILSNSHRFETGLSVSTYSFRPDGETWVKPALISWLIGYSI